MKLKNTEVNLRFNLFAHQQKQCGIMYKVQIFWALTQCCGRNVLPLHTASTHKWCQGPEESHLANTHHESLKTDMNNPQSLKSIRVCQPDRHCKARTLGRMTSNHFTYVN